MFETSYKIRVSARAILLHKDKVLLNNFGGGTYYNFPGGGIEKNETALQVVVREVKEESGLDVVADTFVFALEYEPHHAQNIYGDGHHISFFFRCSLIGEADLQEPSLPDTNPEDPSLISVPKWVPISKLNELNILPHIQKNLADYYKTGVFAPSFFEEPYSKE